MWRYVWPVLILHVLFQPTVYESEISERLSQPGVAIGLACLDTPCFVSACAV